jgi:DNA-binding CsgD family transcriptional regulator
MSPSAAGSETREMAERPSERFLSGDALFVFDADLTIVSWNPAAEELTGVSGEEAVGQNCWEVLGGHDERGNLVCHSGCATARLAREGWPVSHQCLLVNGREGKRRVDVSTLAMDFGDRPLFVHVLVPCSEAARPRAAASSLTPRQLEVLRLLANGDQAKVIAARLGLAEDTVRNHIRAILCTLESHTQLEAVAKARRLQYLIDP